MNSYTKNLENRIAGLRLAIAGTADRLDNALDCQPVSISDQKQISEALVKILSDDASMVGSNVDTDEFFLVLSKTRK